MAEEARGEEILPKSARARIRRRRLLAGSAGVVSVLLLITGGALAVQSFSDRGSRDPAASTSVPDVAEVRCLPEGGVDMPAEIRAQGDGVHFRFIGSEGMAIVQASLDPQGMGIMPLMPFRPGEEVRDQVIRVEEVDPGWFTCIRAESGDAIELFIFRVEDYYREHGYPAATEAHFQRIDVVRKEQDDDGGEESVPDVADVVCEKDGIRILTPTVRPRSDGVHINIVNVSGSDAAFVFESGGRNASGTLVLPIAPGTEELGCVIGMEDAGKIKKETLEVVDPEGLYVQSSADCPGGTVSSSGGLLTPDARGDVGDPVAMTRERFAEQLQPGDEVIRAGYPDDPEPVVAVVREARTVLVQKFFPDGEDRWFMDEYTACSDF